MNRTKSFLIQPVHRFVLAVALIGALAGGVACSTQSPAATPAGAIAEQTSAADPATAKHAATQTSAPASSPSPWPASADPAAPLSPSQLEPTATPTPVPTVAPSPVPSATPIPTSSDVAGWLTYEHEYFGYRFAYPPDARIRTQGVTGFPIEDLPENMTDEAYRKELEEKYPDNLCITVQYEEGFVVFAPVYEKEGRYTVPCGVTGVGDYNVVDVNETVIIDGEPYTATGWRLYERGTGDWHGEFYFLEISNHITIHYGSLTSGTHEQGNRI